MSLAKDKVYNVAVGDRTTLNHLYNAIKSALLENKIRVNGKPIYREFRAGDVRHSQACIMKAQKELSYSPTVRIRDGIQKAMPWYINFINEC